MLGLEHQRPVGPAAHVSQQGAVGEAGHGRHAALAALGPYGAGQAVCAGAVEGVYLLC